MNTLRIADRIYLVAHGTGGTAHLAAEQSPGGRAAFLDDDFEIASRRGWEGEDAACSDEAYEGIPRETKLARRHQVVDALDFIAEGEASLSQPAPSRLRWTTWDV